jgi:putative Mg2+ transporter-C (MgtC) family protein
VSSEWDLLWRLGVALVLSSAIGLEREMRQKSAGLRTHSRPHHGRRRLGHGRGGNGGGAGLAVLATATTAAYFVVAYAYPELAQRLPRSRWASQSLRLTYLDGHGILREALAHCTAAGFAVADLSVHHLGDRDDDDPRAVAVQLELRGAGSVTGLASELSDLDGVLAVSGEDLTGAPD